MAQRLGAPRAYLLKEGLRLVFQPSRPLCRSGTADETVPSVFAPGVTEAVAAAVAEFA